MAAETTSPAVKQATPTGMTLKAVIYSLFFQNVTAEQHTGSYGRTSMGR